MTSTKGQHEGKRAAFGARTRGIARRGVGAAVCAGLLLTGTLATTATAAGSLTADDETNVITGLTTQHMWSDDGGSTWRVGSPDARFPGTRTVIVATLDADVVASTTWDPARTYSSAGTLVRHDGWLWSSKWYANPGERPGANDVWERVRAVDVSVQGTFQFTPWTGEAAHRYQAEQRQYEIERTAVVGYFPEWGIYEGHDNYSVSDVPFDSLTHVNYAFGVLKEDARGEWGIAIWDPWAALEKDGGLYAQMAEATAAHGVHNILSLGGWTNSENGEFEAATATPEKTEQLAQRMVDFMLEHGFSGLDVDWEYPRDAAAADQFEDLLTRLRTKLTALGEANDVYYPLSVAVTPNHTYMEFTKPEAIVDLVDSINVMTYDYHGAFDPVTGHNAPLYASSIDADQKFSTSATMKEFHEVYGVPKNQLLVGVPFYGRAWGGVEATELVDGLPALGAEGSATVHGQWDDEGQFTGSNPYTALKAMERDPAFTKYWDEESQVPYLYNSSTKEFFTYDDARSVQAKVDFIADNEYGGAIIWDLSGDTRDHELGTIVGQLLDERTPDPTPDPEPGDDEDGDSVGQDIQVTVPADEEPGEFVWSVDASDELVDLGEVAVVGDHLRADGAANAVRVTDTRAGGLPWSVSAKVGDFVAGDRSFSGRYLGWTPNLVEAGGDVQLGAAVASGFDGGAGLAGTAVLARAAEGHAVGSTVVGADLQLKAPVGLADGTYRAVLTLTALS